MSLFEMGKIVTTCGVASKMQNDLLFRVGVQQALANHSNGDWGTLCDDDKALNDESVKADQEGRTTLDEIFSSYKIGEQEIWIITECDRSATTVLLPEEY